MMKEELLTNMQTHEAEADEEDVEAGAAEDVQVRSRLSTRSPPSSPGTREPSYLPAEFLPRPLSSSFRCILPTNTIVMGLIPAFILVLAPVPRGFDEQGVFWKDQIFVAFFAILGLMLSTITTLVRVPAFYRISRTRFTIVSVARTRWWYAPCYTMCAPWYSVDVHDIEAAGAVYRAAMLLFMAATVTCLVPMLPSTRAEIREAPLLAPPLLLAPPRTTSSRQMCMLLVRRPLPLSLLGPTYQLWITPQDPRELMNVLARVLRERDTHPPPKKPIKTKASLPPRSTVTLSSAPRPASRPPLSTAEEGGVMGAAGGDGGGSRSNVLGGDWKSIHRDVELIKYKLEGSETLEGLALKFDCKVEDIKRINGMGTASLAAFSTLMLPLKQKEVPT